HWRLVRRRAYLSLDCISPLIRMVSPSIPRRSELGHHSWRRIGVCIDRRDGGDFVRLRLPMAGRRALATSPYYRLVLHMVYFCSELFSAHTSRRNGCSPVHRLSRRYARPSASCLFPPDYENTAVG